MPVHRAARYRKAKRRPILGLGIRDGWRQYVAGMATEVGFGLLILALGYGIAVVAMAVAR